MKLKKTILYAAGAFLTLAFAAIFVSPRVSAAIRAAFVEVVIPSNPFSDKINVSRNGPGVTGPDAGNLGVTNITLTNNDNTLAVVLLNGAYAEGSCTLQNLGSLELGFDMHIYVQPSSTLVIPYPTPLVFGALRHGCLVMQSTNNLEVLVSGFVN